MAEASLITTDSVATILRSDVLESAKFLHSRCPPNKKSKF